jgi:hypothetical protein
VRHANVAPFREGRGCARGVSLSMKSLMHPVPAAQPVAEHEQKQVALAYLREAWTEARLDGVEDDCLAQACLFTALAELVSTYGEDAAAAFAEGLSGRIRNGEFSVDLARQ